MKNSKSKLIENANKKLLAEDYGKNEFDLPSNHKPALIVPKGGSCCMNCKFWDTDKGECINKLYIKWNGDGKIPKPPDEFCSDWWEPKE